MAESESLFSDLREYAEREKSVATEQVARPGQSEAWREYWRGWHGANVNLIAWLDEQEAE